MHNSIILRGWQIIMNGDIYDPCLGWKKAEVSVMDTNSVFRENIILVQNELEKLKQEECPVKHHFSEGSYGREIFLPADTYIIGKIHRHSHVNVISQGECYVLTEDGVQHLKAPITFVSKPGTKRVVYTVTDTIWTTVHVTDSSSLEEIEKEIIAPTYNDLSVSMLQEEIKWLG